MHKHRGHRPHAYCVFESTTLNLLLVEVSKKSNDPSEFYIERQQCGLTEGETCFILKNLNSASSRFHAAEEKHDNVHTVRKVLTCVDAASAVHVGAHRATEYKHKSASEVAAGPIFCFLVTRLSFSSKKSLCTSEFSCTPLFHSFFPPRIATGNQSESPIRYVNGRWCIHPLKKRDRERVRRGRLTQVSNSSNHNNIPAACLLSLLSRSSPKQLSFLLNRKALCFSSHLPLPLFV